MCEKCNLIARKSILSSAYFVRDVAFFTLMVAMALGIKHGVIVAFVTLDPVM
jgi:hypothetical protein